MRIVDRLGGRKVTVAILCAVMSFVLALIGKLSGEWVAIVLGILGIFSAGNFGEHMAERKTE